RRVLRGMRAEAGDRVLAAPDDFIDEHVGHELESAAADIFRQAQCPEPSLFRLGLDCLEGLRRLGVAALENFLVGINQLIEKTGNAIAQILYFGTGFDLS